MFLNCLGQEKNGIYLLPRVGAEFGFSTFENKSSLPLHIKSTNNNHAFSILGLGLAAKIDKWTLIMGYESGNVTWGSSYESKTDSALFETSGSSKIGNTVTRIQLGGAYKVLVTKILRKPSKLVDRYLINKNGNQYWAVFNLELEGGISYENLHKQNNLGELSISGGRFPTNDIVSNRQFPATVLKRRGLGVYVGAYLQFYDEKRPKIRIGIRYQKGLQKYVRTEWETSINGSQFPVYSTISRGSMLSLYVSYPILLKTFKKVDLKNKMSN